MHRSHRIHACIDRITCIDHITWHRSHDMLDFVTVWHPPGIENSRCSIFRTRPCFDTGGHRCHGLHIRYQSDSTDIAANVASPRATAPRHSQYLLYSTLFLAPVHLSIGSSRSGGSERLASASTPSYLQRRYPLQERVSLARSTWSLQLNCISWSYTFVWDTLFPAR